MLRLTVFLKAIPMKTLLHSPLLALALLAFPAAPVSAQTLQCKNQFINVGDLRASVMEKCGEPVAKDSFCKPVEPQTAPSNTSSTPVVVVVPCENVDEWTYNPGYGQFMTTVQFKAGKISAIKYGDRVK
jgi:hypothetical protein